MTEAIRRKLPSLQRQIEAYSIKAWYTIPSAHTTHGVDANAPREPMTLDTPIRIAARIVDELVGGNPANLGACDCVRCECQVWAPDARGRLRYTPCEHDRACPHYGEPEASEVVSARLRALVAHWPALAVALGRGVDHVYDLAELTPAEARVSRYKHDGLSYTSIAFLTDRKEGTVKSLYSRATFKLEQLANVAPVELAA